MTGYDERAHLTDSTSHLLSKFRVNSLFSFILNKKVFVSPCVWRVRLSAGEVWAWSCPIWNQTEPLTAAGGVNVRSSNGTWSYCHPLSKTLNLQPLLPLLAIKDVDRTIDIISCEDFQSKTSQWHNRCNVPDKSIAERAFCEKGKKPKETVRWSFST